MMSTRKALVSRGRRPKAKKKNRHRKRQKTRNPDCKAHTRQWIIVRRSDNKGLNRRPNISENKPGSNDPGFCCSLITFERSRSNLVSHPFVVGNIKKLPCNSTAGVQQKCIVYNVSPGLFSACSGRTLNSARAKEYFLIFSQSLYFISSFVWQISFIFDFEPFADVEEGKLAGEGKSANDKMSILLVL